ncbi:SRPBCC family protein [Salinispora fenicalii]|uniref:SRPBCC family protein n=1 Tax=Salinispora fenicalii TaxID=1137263 RepID=UPI00048A1BFF|nr:hypothetical protein [Salinispora fenicalii]
MRKIYVETMITTSVDEVWRATQDPAEHRRWDARFGRIDPIPGSSPARFRYATTVAPGLTISGWGVHAGERDRPDGSRSSALRFGSDDPRSLIAVGSGYWRYLPTASGVRFLTGYTYTPRWGPLGRAFDLAFRPLFGWATAWSFDRLRIWLEHGVAPEQARRNAAREALARLLGLTAVAAGAAALGGTAPVVTITTAMATVAAVALPPRPHTPAARRCRRRPSKHRAAQPPEELATL